MKNAILTTLSDGGWILWALLWVAVMIYSLIFSIGWQSRRLDRDRAALDLGGVRADEIERRVAALELDRLAWIERRLPFLAVLIGAAPLLGLFGTVAGMLISFDGLAGERAGEPIDMISAGISKALVTTQAGLVIAIPAAFLLALLRRRVQSSHDQIHQRLHEALAHRSRLA